MPKYNQKHRQKQKNKKRKKWSSSEDESSCTPKVSRARGPSSDCNVSDILHETNSILFNDTYSTFDEQDSSSGTMATTTVRNIGRTDQAETVNESPSNADILSYLKRIDSKIVNIELKLQKLDTLEEKVNNFDRELKKLWTYVYDGNKDTSEKFNSFEERFSNVEMSSAQTESHIDHLRSENVKLKDSLTYLQSQSMRNNLLFCGIDESSNETPSESESKVRTFLVDKRKLSQSYVDTLKIERAHRIGTSNKSIQHYSRKIVVKFTYFKDRETVRKERTNLKGTQYFIHEQFPPEVIEKRKQLVPKMRSAKQEGHSAWIAYDTLYIDGRAQSSI